MLCFKNSLRKQTLRADKIRRRQSFNRMFISTEKLSIAKNNETCEIRHFPETILFASISKHCLRLDVYLVHLVKYDTWNYSAHFTPNYKINFSLMLHFACMFTSNLINFASQLMMYYFYVEIQTKLFYAHMPHINSLKICFYFKRVIWKL